MGRIVIQKKDRVVVDGRWQEAWSEYYNCWCEPSELYGEELYAAENIKYTNVLKFKVRYCNKIKAMRTTKKDKFRVIFEETSYEVYQVDFKNNSKDYVYIKAKLVV